MSHGPASAARRPCRHAVAAALAVGMLLAASLATAATQRDAPALPDNPLHGRLLFEAKHCNQCHGIGTEGPGTGPNLGEGRFRGTFLDLGAALWNHVPGMSVRFAGRDLSWPQLSADEALDLVTFLYAIEYLGRPGDPQTGKAAFARQGCGACHAIGGRGGAVGPDLVQLNRFASPLFVAQAIWNHGPAMLKSMARRNVTPPVLGEGDIADLSAYIRQLAAAGTQERVLLAPGNPNHGRAVFAAERCVACHSVHGQGGTDGPDLGEADLHRAAETIAGRMWNHALTMSTAMEAKGLPWPQVSASDLADLIAYLYFLPFADPPGDSSRGARVFADHSCAGCHRAGGAAANAGPDLADSRATDSPAALVAAMWDHAPVMQTAILSQGRPWPELTGADLRDLLAYLRTGTAGR